MKPTKKNVCVFIEDEVQLEQARELLVKYGENIDESLFKSKPFDSYLVFSEGDNDWWICNVSQAMVEYDHEITLTELEKILSDGKETE